MVVKDSNKKCTILTILSVQASSVKYIHTVWATITTIHLQTLNSAKPTLYPFNSNSLPFPSL